MDDPRVELSQVNGIRLAFRRWPGPAVTSQPPVVLLHGVLQTGEGLRHLARWLGKSGEVLVPDCGAGAAARRLTAATTR